MSNNMLTENLDYINFAIEKRNIIKNRLKPFGYFENPDISAPILLKYYESQDQANKNEISREITEFLRASSKAFDHPKTYFDNKESQNKLEAHMQSVLRANERKDMWKLWFHKLIRWTVGVFLTIFLYSLFVYLSEKIDFIKIPIKDSISEFIKK